MKCMLTSIREDTLAVLHQSALGVELWIHLENYLKCFILYQLCHQCRLKDIKSSYISVNITYKCMVSKCLSIRYRMKSLVS